MKRRQRTKFPAPKSIPTPNKAVFSTTVQIDSYAIGALFHVYSFQTMNEQHYNCTNEKNGEGFNGTDAGFCSSLVKQYESRGYLTTKQLASLKKLLPKYWRQVSSIKPMKNGKSPAINGKKVKPEQKLSATLHGNTIHLKFQYNQDLVYSVKLLHGRKFNKADLRWEVPMSVDNIDRISELGFPLDKKITNWYQSQTAQVTGDGLEVPGLRAVLRPYQKDGVAFIDSRAGRALIGDDMGLGKTIQAIAWLQKNKETALPAIVVCPSSFKLGWAREAMKFTDICPVIVSGKKKMEFITFPTHPRKELYIANYDVIHSSKSCPDCKGTGKRNGMKCKTCSGKGKIPVLHSDLAKIPFKTTIYDEIHYLKNRNTARSVAASELSSPVDHVIGLSGTPITNRPIEFFNGINLINPRIFPSWWDFGRRYCDMKSNGFGLDTSGSSNLKELHEKLTKTIMLRRLKRDVLPELPTKVRSVVPVEVDTRKYKSIVNQAKAQLKAAGSKAEHLTIIEKSKQAVVELKLQPCIEWIQEYLDSGNKLVVFADHKSTIKRLEKEFKNNHVTVYGGTSDKSRQLAVDRFQQDETIRLFIGSKAAKEAVTLTAASATCFIELWWTPGDHDQAEDRVNRIGQTADSINAYYLLAADTIEEDIAELLDEKRKVLAAVLDGEDVEDINILAKLMEKILKEENK